MAGAIHTPMSHGLRRNFNVTRTFVPIEEDAAAYGPGEKIRLPRVVSDTGPAAQLGKVRPVYLGRAWRAGAAKIGSFEKGLFYWYDTPVNNERLFKARKILKNCLYATIATVCEDGSPWNSPVFICSDSKLVLYWASAIESQHSKNIIRDGRVFLVLFDSHDSWGEGQGLYITALAQEVKDKAEIDKACELRVKKVGAANQTAAGFTGKSPRRIYRAVPEQVWLNEVKGKSVDIRARINLRAFVDGL
jgi:general stress protein 26